MFSLHPRLIVSDSFPLLISWLMLNAVTAICCLSFDFLSMKFRIFLLFRVVNAFVLRDDLSAE